MKCGEILCNREIGNEYSLAWKCEKCGKWVCEDHITADNDERWLCDDCYADWKENQEVKNGG